MNLQEALLWIEKNCMYNDVRKRLKSRAVGYTMYTEFHNLLKLNKNIIEENNKLKKENSNLRALLK